MVVSMKLRKEFLNDLAHIIALFLPFGQCHVEVYFAPQYQ